MPGRQRCPEGCGCAVHRRPQCPNGCGCGKHRRTALHNELIGIGVRRSLRNRGTAVGYKAAAGATAVGYLTVGEVAK